MSTQPSVRWGILSTGSIAKTFARGLRDSQTGQLVAVASRNQAGADAFGDEFDVPKRFADYQSLLNDPDVDAVYIATPHPLHAEWAIKAADAGKHVLCEKPLTLNWPDAQRVVEAAKRNGMQLMEAFMYRCHPQTAKIVELIQSGALGEVRQIEATFSFDGGGNPDSRLNNLELGGGGILDVGCYTVSLVRLIAGVAQGKPFAQPLEVKALGVLGETGADDYTTAVFKFPGQILATCSTGVRLNGGGFARIVGTKAILRVPSPWFCSDDPALVLETFGADTQNISVPGEFNLYAYEADAMAVAIETGSVPSPAQSGDDALGNMHTLDLWRQQIGLVYPQEKLERLTVSASQEPLRVYPNTMAYGHLESIKSAGGETKKISKIVMGTMLEGGIEPYTHGLALFDDFYERGGTCFDTAHIYGGQVNSELVVGHWLKTRGVRDELTIIVKGAHPPKDSITGFQQELAISLDRLGLDGGDIYMLHRDNVQVPVGEWVDALNEGVQKGYYKEYGGSNWSLERLEAANAYAREKGVQGFSVVSNNFSLARMVDPVWGGCVSASDPVSKAWFEKHGLSLFSWSSQARGFFARADQNFTSDGELVRCWYSDDNFERLQRAQQLAKEKGVSPVVIAAAYVLNQSFPIYALIGPRSTAETRDSLHAFEVEITPAEAKWLNLEA